MAVTLSKTYDGFSGTFPINALDDNWIKFQGQSDPIKASIELDNGSVQKTFEISPDVNTDFYFNIKEAVKSFFTRAVDDFDYTVDETDPSDLVQSISMEITITHSVSANDVTTIAAQKFIKGKARRPANNYVSAAKRLTPKMIHFTGYPFCVTAVEDNGDIVRYAGSNNSEYITHLDDSETLDDEKVLLDL